MKKQYETPKAERFDFNYQENVVASNTGRIEGYKDGNDNNGCWQGANASKGEPKCTHY